MWEVQRAEDLSWMLWFTWFRHSTRERAGGSRSALFRSKTFVSLHVILTDTILHHGSLLLSRNGLEPQQLLGHSKRP